MNNEDLTYEECSSDDSSVILETIQSRQRRPQTAAGMKRERWEGLQGAREDFDDFTCSAERAAVLAVSSLPRCRSAKTLTKHPADLSF